MVQAIIIVMPRGRLFTAASALTCTYSDVSDRFIQRAEAEFIVSVSLLRCKWKKRARREQTNHGGRPRTKTRSEVPDR